MTGRIPAARVTGGEGGEVWELHQVRAHLWVAWEVEGMVGARASMASSGRRSSGSGGEVAPVGIGRGGGVGELREDIAELLVGSARMEEGCSGGSAAALSSPELRMDGGGVLRRRSGEKVKEREDQVAGVLVVLMRTRERGPGL